jgi:sarcosine oxidase
MASPDFEIAVVGLGAAGSSALGCLARAGVRAMGIDRYAPPHAQGSSHGEARLLRVAYAEGANYVPMARRSIALWRALEARTDAKLFYQTGVTYGGPPDSAFLSNARQSADRWHGSLLDLPSGNGPSIPPGWRRFQDSEAGFLECEKSIAAFLRDAAAHGARIDLNRQCHAFEFTPDSVILRTGGDDISAARVIMASGAWATQLVPSLAAITHIERRVVHWFADPAHHYALDAGFLPFMVEAENGDQFYGFPTNADGEVRVAEHRFGEPVASPEVIDRDISAADIARAEPLARRFLPALGERTRSQVCMYPMSRDEHFILDRHPGEPRLTIGAGLSGHGFKFAPVIGEALANLAMDRPQQIDIDDFALSRFPEFQTA